MKFKYVFHTMLLLIATNFFGQECNCIKNISLVQQKVEDNQASFQHQVIEQNRKAEYDLFKSFINKKSKEINDLKNCLGLVSLYLSFIQDEHSYFSYTKNYKPKPNKIIKTNRNNCTESLPFEGIWYFQDGSFSINVLPATTTFGEWVAVVNKSQAKTWKKRQLKIEFLKNTVGTYSCIYWRQDLIPKALSVSYTDSTLLIGRNLTFYRKEKAKSKTSSSFDNLLFKALSESTNYLKIPSFDLTNQVKIDSLITANRIEITSKKNLIIDLRNNGGGGFEAFQALLPFVLDTNIVCSPYNPSVWVSKENYTYYNESKYEFAETKQDSINELKYVEVLNAHAGSFTPVEFKTDTIQLEKNSPQNIAIIYNRNTASSAEGFILQVRSSKKVSTYGENSAGAVSYGDWMPIEIPELNIWLAITTKKMIFKNNENFESIGITPDFDLKASSEDKWLNIVKEKMERKN